MFGLAFRSGSRPVELALGWRLHLSGGRGNGASGGTARFYEPLRWPGWQAETRVLPVSHGISAYPFLWSQQTQHDLAATARRPVPMADLFLLHNEFAARLTKEPDTTAIHVRIE